MIELLVKKSSLSMFLVTRQKIVNVIEMFRVEYYNLFSLTNFKT